ncbi:MAG: sigma-70 family RNA polymerase sigma factor [Lachnospiraceae bacterium]|nr:sigma-70 family RNA polymerase sigma factor [Ruminococcus sp.]MCM1276090.1 sigma-70 family RNA polymerase sigma factor [Lachnospiraceae bacterium]
MNNDIAFSPSGSVVTVFENVSERRSARLDDSEIIGMLFDRDEGGLAAVKDKYGSYCASIARNILENPQDTEECVNDAYMRLWETIPPEKPRALSAFLAKITRNLAIDRYRREHMQKRGGDETALIFEELEECVSDGSSVEATAERREMIAAVNRFLARLPAKSRVMFVARYCYCESTHSIAARFGMKENNVSVCLNRTRAKLRDFMKKEGYEL